MPNALHILRHNDLLIHEQLGQLGVSLLVFVEDLLSAIIQLVDYLQHLFINQTCGLFAVRLLETILAVVVVAYIGELVAHTIISHHAKGSLRGT